MKAFCRLDGIVTLIDAKHIEQHLDEEKPEGAENESVGIVVYSVLGVWGAWGIILKEASPNFWDGPFSALFEVDCSDQQALAKSTICKLFADVRCVFQ